MTAPPEMNSTATPVTVRLEEVSRRLGLFLTALWGRSFRIEAAGGDVPHLRDGVVYLPAIVRASDRDCAERRYRAAAVHAGGHLVYSTTPFVAEGLRPRQQALISLIEDARVESLTCAAFPGLRRLFLGQLTQRTGPHLVELMADLARALLDPSAPVDHVWISKGRSLFEAQRMRLEDPNISREIGLALAHDIGQLRIPMNERSALVIADYRDDNAGLWTQVRELSAPSNSEPSTDAPTQRRGAHLEEREAGRELSFGAAQGSTDELAYLLRLDEVEAVLDLHRGKPPVVEASYGLPEWDYRIGHLKTDWCRLRECAPAEVFPSPTEEITKPDRVLIERLAREVLSLRQSHRRLTRQFEGEELDLDATLEVLGQWRSGRLPEPRIHVQRRLHSDHELALLVLLDLSESTNDRVGPGGPRLIDLQREAVVVLASLLTRLGIDYAIHGFNSRGREDVAYYRFVDFGEGRADLSGARLGALRGEYSTRLGAGLRRALTLLSGRPEPHRLLLVVTDGEPADIDVHDDRYLAEDARHAIQAVWAQGVRCFGLGVGAVPEPTLRHLFGPGAYAVLDRAERLPKVLPRLFLRLSRPYLS